MDNGYSRPLCTLSAVDTHIQGKGLADRIVHDRVTHHPIGSARHDVLEGWEGETKYLFRQTQDNSSSAGQSLVNNPYKTLRRKHVPGPLT